MSQRHDPVAALRAVVEANARYVAATGREMDVVVLNPQHARELLKLLEHPLQRVHSVSIGTPTDEEGKSIIDMLKKAAYSPGGYVLGKGGIVGMEPGQVAAVVGPPAMFWGVEEEPDPLMSRTTEFPDYSRAGKRQVYKPECRWRLPDPNCAHGMRTVFASDGRVFCHDCRAWLSKDESAIETHRRSSSIESDKSI